MENGERATTRVMYTHIWEISNKLSVKEKVLKRNRKR